jgi:cytidine deaminase
MEDGSIEIGSNQENAAYPSGLCAERVALFSVASRYPGKAIRQLCVCAKRDPDGVLVPVSPCGACRQVILEMELRQKTPIEIVMLWKPDQWIVAPSAMSLLPYSFSAENL